jgi:phage terminase small subunit
MSLASKLTNRQLMFVAEYLVDQNVKAAAVRAGYSEQTRRKHSFRELNQT